MTRPRQWRVRVLRKSEAWVDVQAFTAYDAEIEAANRPGVLSVFAKSAVPADQIDEAPRPQRGED
jgi:hypothetical protein